MAYGLKACSCHPLIVVDSENNKCERDNKNETCKFMQDMGHFRAPFPVICIIENDV